MSPLTIIKNHIFVLGVHISCSCVVFIVFIFLVMKRYAHRVPNKFYLFEFSDTSERFVCSTHLPCLQEVTIITDGLSCAVQRKKLAASL